MNARGLPYFFIYFLCYRFLLGLSLFFRLYRKDVVFFVHLAIYKLGIFCYNISVKLWGLVGDKCRHL